MNNGEMIWLGNYINATEGVGFLLNKRTRLTLIWYNQINSRIIVAKFRGQAFNISVVQVYVPTSSSLSDKSILQQPRNNVNFDTRKNSK